MDCIRERDAAIKIIAAVMDRGIPDAREIIRLVGLHSEAIEKTEIFLSANCSNEWGFASFIEGVQVAVMEGIENDISERQWDALDSIRLSDAGEHDCLKVISCGDAFVNEAAIFADMCKNGRTPEKLAMLIEAGEVIE